MDASTFFSGILPVLAFVILDSLTTKKTALWGAMGLALAELIFTLVQYHTIDALTIFSVVLVILFAWISIKKNDDIFFKLQPAILGVFLALSCFFFYYLLDKPILNYMMDKYFHNNVDVFLRNKVPRDYFFEVLRLLSRDLGWWLLLHAALTAYAAFRLSKWWWFVIRVPVFYVLLFTAMLVEQRFVLVWPLPQ